MPRKRRDIITITSAADSNTRPISRKPPNQTLLNKQKQLDYTSVFGGIPVSPSTSPVTEAKIVDHRNDKEDHQMMRVRPQLIQESDISELQESIQSAFPPSSTTSGSTSAIISPHGQQRQQDDDGLGFDDILRDFTMEDESEVEALEQDNDIDAIVPFSSPGMSCTSSDSRSSKDQEEGLRDVNEIVKDLTLAGKKRKKKNKKHSGSLRYCTDRNEYYREAEESGNITVPSSSPESCTSSGSRSSKRRENRLRDFNEIVKDLTLAGKKKKNEDTSASRLSDTERNQNENQHEKEDHNNVEEEKHEQHDNGTTLESEADDSSIAMDSAAHPGFEITTNEPRNPESNLVEDTRTPSILDPCFCGNDLAMQTLEHLQKTYGVELNAREFKENFVNDLEMDRLVADLQDLQKEISTVDMAEVLQKVTIAASADNPCPESNQRLLLAIAEAHECASQQPSVAPEPPVQSSFSCIPDADDTLGDEEEGLEIPYMSCHEEKVESPSTSPAAPNKKKTIFGFLSSSSSQKNKTSFSRERKPDVVRLKLNDGTMATVSRDTATKLRTCNWV